MGVTRRNFLGASVAMATVGCVSERGAVPQSAAAQQLPRQFSLGQRTNLKLPYDGLVEPVRFFVIGDTHYGYHDGRDDAYADNYRRMAGGKTKPGALASALKRAREFKADIVLLVGDNISFPTYANIETLQRELDESGVDWLYTAGNHDWHFEGMPGSDIDQRRDWIGKRLGRFYRGENPLCHSKVVKGVRFVIIDNSVYHILPEQLEFWKREAAKGDPIALFMHIPLWVDGWGLFTCGCPTWGAETDPYWKIERREKWAVRQAEESFEFREAVLSTPNLVGVFTGHEHRLMAAQVGRSLMFSVPSNRDGSAMSVELG